MLDTYIKEKKPKVWLEGAMKELLKLEKIFGR